MRICGFAAEGLRSERLIHETFPVKELQDYWSSRPKYEEVNDKSGDFVSGSSSKGGAGSSSEAGTGPGQPMRSGLHRKKTRKRKLLLHLILWKPTSLPHRPLLPQLQFLLTQVVKLRPQRGQILRRSQMQACMLRHILADPG